MIPTKSIKAVAFLLIVVLFFSCEKETTIEMDNTLADVASDLQTYFDRFEVEAQLRGLSINLQELGINGTIADISGENVAGMCTYSSEHPSLVTVDSDYWQEATNLGKEFIVFHELGHCALGRDHREDDNENGLCLSIMRSGTGGCIDAYSTTNRTAYLNELFDSQFFDELF